MKIGDLVQWSQQWLRGCGSTSSAYKDAFYYRDQVGIVMEIGVPDNCWRVLWSDGEDDEVHYDYLEVLCK